MMRFVAVCSLFALALTVPVPDAPASLEVLCQKYECPDVDRSVGADYETRTIKGANWVGVQLDDMSAKSKKSAFWKLFGYIQGQNDQGAKIDMTIPVVYKWCANGASMHFYIPSKYQAPNTPVPTDSDVTVETWGTMNSYSRAFGGSVNTEAKYKQEFQTLKDDLTADGKLFSEDCAITLSYTRPGWGQQRMEVMYKAEE